MPAPGSRQLTGLAVREAPNHFHAQAIARRGDRRPRRRSATIALGLWKIASDIRLMGMGPRAGLAELAPAGDPARLLDHARQGEPGHRREPDDGRRPGRRQRRHDRVRPDRLAARAQRDAAGDRRSRSSSRSRCSPPRRATSASGCVEGLKATDRGPAARRAGADAGDGARARRSATTPPRRSPRRRFKTGRTIRELATGARDRAGPARRAARPGLDDRARSRGRARRRLTASGRLSSRASGLRRGEQVE